MEKCKLKAEADSWRLTKKYSIRKNNESFIKYEPKSLKDFFVNTFYNVFCFNGEQIPLCNKNIFQGCNNLISYSINVSENGLVLGSNKENINFLQECEKKSLIDESSGQTFDRIIKDFFDFVKEKLFVGDNLDKLTDEGKKIEAAIEARKKILDDIIKIKKVVNYDNKARCINENPIFKCIKTKDPDYIEEKYIEYKLDEVLKKIDNACQTLQKTKEDTERIDLLKQKIDECFKNNGKLEPRELEKMLSEVDLFNSEKMFKKMENEFVKQKMQEKLKANNMTLEQLDEFGNKEVNGMLGHLSTSIWLTRSFLLGGVLSKEMGIDKILEGFREKCYRLLYKFGDQEINSKAIENLGIELNQEVGKIKKEIGSKCQRYCDDIGMNNWESVKPKLQKLKKEILEDNYYTQQLTPGQIEALKQQTFDFDSSNLINFLQLLPKKLEESIDKAKKNIVNYCKDIKNNNKQSIKDLLKQLKNDKMQNNHIIYSTNMTGMTPSYMIELTDEHQKKSNRNLGKMYYEVKNGQIVPLVTNKQEYEEALREFENKLANTEKNGLTDNTPGLEGIKFYEYDDIERLQSEKLMKFVKEGKKKKNEIMGWIEKEEENVGEKFPEDTKIKEPRDNIKHVSNNSQPEYTTNNIIPDKLTYDTSKSPRDNMENYEIDCGIDISNLFYKKTEDNNIPKYITPNNNPTYSQCTKSPNNLLG